MNATQLPLLTDSKKGSHHLFDRLFALLFPSIVFGRNMQPGEIMKGNYHLLAITRFCD